DGLIGFFVNTLVIRVELSGAMRTADLLDQIRVQMAEAQANQEAPFHRLLEFIQPERRPGHSPLFQVMFSLDRSDSIRLPGVQTATLDSPIEAAQFDLTLNITERGADIQAAFEYATDLFDVATIERLHVGYEQILTGLCLRPDVRVDDLNLPVEGDWQRPAVD